MEWLDNLEEAWGKAATEVGNFKGRSKGLPDGITRAQILGHQLTLEEKRRMIKFKLRFIDHENIERTKVLFLSGNLLYPMRELSNINSSSALSQLSEVLKTTTGKVVEVEVKTKPGEKYSQYYFRDDLNTYLLEDIPEDPFTKAQDNYSSNVLTPVADSPDEW